MELKSFNGYSYASTQVNLPEPLASQITDWAAANIPADSLHPESQGQDVPHITVKYGILDDSPASSEAALKFTGPLQATLRAMKVFRFSPNYDVLVIAVDSPDLHNANSTLKASVPTVDTFPTYDPHVTVAYVKKGEGEAFDGNAEFSGQDLQFGSVIFSSKDGQEYEIPLNGYDFYSPYSSDPEDAPDFQLDPTAVKYSDDEPRDDSGKWTAGGSEPTHEVDPNSAPYPSNIAIQSAFDGGLSKDEYLELAKDTPRLRNEAQDYETFEKANDDWVRNASGEAKTEVAHILATNSAVRTLSLHDAWQQSAKAGEKFSDWLDRPQELHRYGSLSGDLVSFAASEARAKDASGGEGTGGHSTVRLAPKYWLGAGRGMGEVYVDPSILRNASETKSWEDEPRDESGKWTTGDADTDRKLAALRWEGRKLRETLKTHEAKLKDARSRGDEAAIKEHDANHRRTAIELRKLREQHHQLAGKKEYKNPYEKRATDKGSGDSLQKSGPTSKPEAQAVREQILSEYKSVSDNLEKLGSDVVSHQMAQGILTAQIKQMQDENDETPKYSVSQMLDRLRPLQDKRSEHYEQMTVAQGKINELNKSLTDKLRQHLYQPVSVNDYKPYISNELRPKEHHIQAGLDSFHRLAGDSIPAPKGIAFQKTKGKERSNATAAQVSLDPNAEESVVVHELGHVLESNNPQLHEAAVKFLAKRTAGEKLESLKKVTGFRYGAQEKTRKDKFINAYMGKDYTPQYFQELRKQVPKGEIPVEYYTDPKINQYTEIISMGLEYMHSQPHVLAEKDPEYFDFMYNVLRGNYDAV